MPIKSILEMTDEHMRISKDKLALKPPFPDKIKIELSSYCNYSCLGCANKKGLRPQGNIDKDVLYKIVKEAKKIGVKEIELFLLGELFPLDELTEYIGYIKNKIGIECVSVATNGSSASLDRLMPMITNSLDSIKFSINAPNKEIYLEKHGTDNFELVINNVKNLYTYVKNNKIKKFNISISSIYDEKYKDEYEKFKNEISEYVDNFYYLPICKQSKNHNGGCIISNFGCLDMVPDVPCSSLFGSAKVTWNGYLTACYFGHDRRFEIVNLREISLLKAWNHNKFKSIRSDHLYATLKGSLCSKCLNI